MQGMLCPHVITHARPCLGNQVRLMPEGGDKTRQGQAREGSTVVWCFRKRSPSPLSPHTPSHRPCLHLSGPLPVQFSLFRPRRPRACPPDTGASSHATHRPRGVAHLTHHGQCEYLPWTQPPGLSPQAWCLLGSGGKWSVRKSECRSGQATGSLALEPTTNPTNTHDAQHTRTQTYAYPP
jgi:hypothetical protein